MDNNEEIYENGSFTTDEILTQPIAWENALEVIRNHTDQILDMFKHNSYGHVIFCGCGSTYYLSLSAASVFRYLTGRYAVGLPASEIWLNPRFSFPSEGRGLLIAVSRSGETTETIRACHFFQSKGYGDVITLTCYPDQPMASMGNLNLVFPSGQEKSVAQTRAFSTLYLSAISIAALFSHRSDIIDQLSIISSSGRKVLQEYRTKLCDLGRNEFLDRFYFLGSGLRYGLASEISLKMKEMSLSHSEPFHFMEFRHGPKSMVTKNTLIFGLISNENYAYEKDVLDETQSLGGFVLSVGENDSDINFNSKMHEVVSSILYLPIGQTLALSRSFFKGLNPDLPHNLSSVVRLKNN